MRCSPMLIFRAWATCAVLYANQVPLFWSVNAHFASNYPTSSPLRPDTTQAIHFWKILLAQAERAD